MIRDYLLLACYFYASPINLNHVVLNQFRLAWILSCSSCSQGSSFDFFCFIHLVIWALPQEFYWLTLYWIGAKLQIRPAVLPGLQCHLLLQLQTHEISYKHHKFDTFVSVALFCHKKASYNNFLFLRICLSQCILSTQQRHALGTVVKVNGRHSSIRIISMYCKKQSANLDRQR